MTDNFNLPRYVEWQITARCNLDCIHCATGSKDPAKDLSTPRATTLVHELLDAKIKSVTLSGGEPLLREDWELLTGIFKENGVSVQLISNGLCLGEEMARKIHRLGVNFVWLSLDGTEQGHNTIRRHPRSYSGVMQAASQLEKMSVPFGFMTTLLCTNYDQLPELNEIVQGTAAGLWQIWLGNKTNTAPIWLKPKQIREVLHTLPRLRARTPQLIIGDNIGYNDALEPLRIPAFVEYCASSRFTGCYGARTIMGILNDGSIRGCLSMPESNVSAPLSTTKVHLPLVQRYRQAVLQHHIAKETALRACRGCAQLRDCNGGCPAYALSTLNDNEKRFCHVPSQTQPIRSTAISASLATLCMLATGGCQPALPQQPIHVPMNEGPPQIDTEKGADTNTTVATASSPRDAVDSDTATADTSAGNEGESSVSSGANRSNRSTPCTMSHVGCRDDLLIPSPKKD